MGGIHNFQGPYPDFFNVKFKNNLLNNEWIFGTWLDEDSTRRCVAYRECGKWVSLPIHFNPCCNAIASDIELHGDTLCIIGTFGTPTSDLDSTQTTYASGFLKWWNDNLWFENRIYGARDISISNDSILVWGDYVDSSFIRFGHNLSVDGGQTWQYPYSIIHPTETTSFSGAFADLQIHQGQIYSLNNDSAPNDSTGWKGIVRWDGTQWHPFPYGMWGGLARATNLEFYKNELYMGGTIFKSDHPYNPSNGIAKWDGTAWTGMGGGVNGFVIDLFLHDSLLYSFTSDSGFADAPISYFAAWDGHQWCGTPGNFARPPISFGFANDTLFCTFNEQSTTIGTDTVTHMNYFVGNYVNGPNSVCSTYNLGEIEFLAFKNQLQVYPNPTTGQFTLQLPNEAINSIVVYDVNGALVFSKTYNNGLSEISLDLGNLASGIYFIHANNTYHALVSKL